MKLGKKAHKYDPRTLPLAEFLADDIRVPDRFDFDSNRLPITARPWGAHTWRNCVVVAQANHILRLERIRKRQTLTIRANMCVNRYKQLSGSKFQGDMRDKGLVVLDAMIDWRTNGFPLGNFTHSIDAFGELDPNDLMQLRRTCYALSGIHIGFWLPKAVHQMKFGVWEYKGETGLAWKAGSYGGHLAYSKSYNPYGFEIISDGKEVFVTNEFVKRYCDEAWGVVDDFSSARAKQVVDTDGLFQRITQVTR